MYWNYRVIKTPCVGIDGESTWLYAIHEVYYDEDEKPGSWTMNPMTLNDYDDYDDLKGSLELMEGAFKKPVLELVQMDCGEEYLI